ncbi:MAG: hypothetical protein V4539_11270 [Bacteroidota bacterium]
MLDNTDRYNRLIYNAFYTHNRPLFFMQQLDHFLFAIKAHTAIVFDNANPSTKRGEKGRKI